MNYTKLMQSSTTVFVNLPSWVFQRIILMPGPANISDKSQKHLSIWLSSRSNREVEWRVGISVCGARLPSLVSVKLQYGDIWRTPGLLTRGLLVFHLCRMCLEIKFTSEKLSLKDNSNLIPKPKGMQANIDDCWHASHSKMTN